MPKINKYVAVIGNPIDFKELCCERNKLDSGIDIVWGLTDNMMSIQSINFDKEKFDSNKVHEWLTQNKFTPSKFECPAESCDAQAQLETVLFDNMKEILIDVDQIDYIPISLKGSIETTPEGFLKAIAPVAKTGIYTYYLPDGTVRRDLVDEDTLFTSDAMKTLELKPFTNEHPLNLLDPLTVTRHTVGSTGEKVFRDEDYLMSSLVITDAHAIQHLKDGKRQLSPGYKVTLVVEPGVYKGQHYDVKQRRRIYNHLALCTKARGGDTLAINLQDNMQGESFIIQQSKDKGAIMPKVKINGIDYDAAQEVINHIDSLMGKVQTTEQTVVTLKDSLDKVTKENTTIQASFDAYKSGVPSLVTSAVKERVRFVKLAETVLDKADLDIIDTLDNTTVKAKMIAKKYPTLDITGKDEAYMSALVDSISVTPAQSTALQDQLNLLANRPAANQTPIVDSVKSRNEYMTGLKDSWKKDPKTGK